MKTGIATHFVHRSEIVYSNQFYLSFLSYFAIYSELLPELEDTLTKVIPSKPSEAVLVIDKVLSSYQNKSKLDDDAAIFNEENLSLIK